MRACHPRVTTCAFGVVPEHGRTQRRVAANRTIKRKTALLRGFAGLAVCIGLRPIRDSNEPASRVAGQAPKESRIHAGA